eukprot:403971-Prorocentrum_lima.AAC.1
MRFATTLATEPALAECGNVAEKTGGPLVGTSDLTPTPEDDPVPRTMLTFAPLFPPRALLLFPSRM